MNFETRTGQQAYKSIKRKLVDLPFEQVIQPLLSNMQPVSRFALRYIPGLYSLGDRPHQLGADAQVFAFPRYVT